MHVIVSIVFVVIAITDHNVESCGKTPLTPAQRAVISDMSKKAGMEPFYPNGGMGNTGFAAGQCIRSASDLNCNFNIAGQALAANAKVPNNTRNIDTCLWTNMPSNTMPLDTFDTDYYLFVQKSKNAWAAFLPRGTTSITDARTPVINDVFALTGSQSNLTAAAFTKTAKNPNPPAPPQSIFYSEAIKCMKNAGRLSFDYWLFLNAKVRVVLLAEKTFNVLWEVPKTDQGLALPGKTPLGCGPVFPRDGRCSVPIPPQDNAFHIAIHSYDLLNQFAIIDNIVFDADLGAGCSCVDDPFDFKLTPTPIADRTGLPAVTAGAQLNCDGSPTGCKWSNSNYGTPPPGVKWVSVTGPIVDATKWAAQTGQTTMPTGQFYYTRGNSSRAELVSDVFDCQYYDGDFTFKAWMSVGMQLRVCVVNATTLQYLQACQVVDRSQGPSYKLTVFGPLKNFRILFNATDWNSGNGAFAAVDDLTYTGKTCVEAPPPTPAPVSTTPSPDVNDIKACQVSKETFEPYGSVAEWRPYTVGGSINGHPLVPYKLDNKLTLSLSTQANCPDGGTCAGCAIDKTKNTQVCIMAVTIPALQADRYVQMRMTRGTYGTQIDVCRNALPKINTDGSRGTGDCTTIAGPGLTYNEYRYGTTAGAPLPKGTKDVYIVMTNPIDSGADLAGFQIDNIQMLRTASSTSGPLC